MSIVVVFLFEYLNACCLDYYALVFYFIKLAISCKNIMLYLTYHIIKISVWFMNLSFNEALG